MKVKHSEKRNVPTPKPRSSKRSLPKSTKEPENPQELSIESSSIENQTLSWKRTKLSTPSSSQRILQDMENSEDKLPKTCKTDEDESVERSPEEVENNSEEKE